jgi:hypothetical protein
MAYSADGIAWTAVDGTFSRVRIQGIAYGIFADGGGRFYIAGNTNGAMAYSENGASWTSVTNSGFGSTQINGIAYGGGRFVVVGASGKMAWAAVE